MGTTAKKTSKRSSKKSSKSMKKKSSSKSFSKKRKMSMSATPPSPPLMKKRRVSATPPPTPPKIIYNQYRDICIVKTPPNRARWFSPNIAYRRSTGTSNENFCEGRIKTSDFWVPTFGTVTETNLASWRTLVQLDPPIDTGYITKIGNIFHIEFGMSLSFNPSSILKQFSTLSKMIQNMVNTDAELTELKRINDANHGLVYCLLQEVFPHYFMDWTQLQISAFLGGDFWNQIPEFRDFILTHDIPSVVEKRKFSRITKLDSPFGIEIIRPSTSVHENQINLFTDENGALAPFMKDEKIYTTTEIKKMLKNY